MSAVTVKVVNTCNASAVVESVSAALGGLVDWYEVPVQALRIVAAMAAKTPRIVVFMRFFGTLPSVAE